MFVTICTYLSVFGAGVTIGMLYMYLYCHHKRYSFRKRNQERK